MLRASPSVEQQASHPETVLATYSLVTSAAFSGSHCISREVRRGFFRISHSRFSLMFPARSWDKLICS